MKIAKNKAEIVVEVKGKWYFWNSQYSYRHGPYETEEQAKKEAERYYAYHSRGKHSDGLGPTTPGMGAV